MPAGLLPDALRTTRSAIIRRFVFPSQRFGIAASDGVVPTKCFVKSLLKNNKCVECPINALCDGTSKAVDCSSSNTFNAVLCKDDRIVKCIPNHALINGFCIDCAQAN